MDCLNCDLGDFCDGYDVFLSGLAKLFTHGFWVLAKKMGLGIGGLFYIWTEM